MIFPKNAFRIKKTENAGALGGGSPGGGGICNTGCNTFFYIKAMGITISTHAKEQAEKRGISEDGIKTILAGNPAVAVPSKTDPEAVVVFGEHESKTWGVVLNANTYNVITVRPASKKERRFYEQKTGN